MGQAVRKLFIKWWSDVEDDCSFTQFINRNRVLDVMMKERRRLCMYKTSLESQYEILARAESPEIATWEKTLGEVEDYLNSYGVF